MFKLKQHLYVEFEENLKKLNFVDISLVYTSDICIHWTYQICHGLTDKLNTLKKLTLQEICVNFIALIFESNGFLYF